MPSVIYIFAFLSGVSFHAVSHETPVNCDSLKQLSWLKGQWRTSDTLPATYEHWSQVSAETLEGKSWQQTQAGTRSIESMRLVQMNYAVFFIAKVAHNDMPVPFTATRCETTSVLLENQAHDFPKSLYYRFHTDSGYPALSVEVRGEGNKGFTLQFSQYE